ncbi:MAG: flippase [candidate division KSB1 bacterium]|nr:flippase [candidate division KSB1 bacterium]
MFVFLGRIVGLGLNMVTIVVLARAWSEEMFGIFSYALVLVGFFSLLPDFGMQPVLIREMARCRSRAGDVVGLGILSKLGLSLLSLALASGTMLLFFPDPRMRITFAWLSLTMFLSAKVNTMRVVLEGVFYADMDMGLPVIFQLVDGVLQVALVVVLVGLGATPAQVIAGYALSSLPGLILTIAFVWQRVRPSFRLDVAALKWLLGESFPLFLYLGLTMLHERMDVLFLNSLWGEGAVGVYSTAFRFTAPLGIVPFAVATALYPVMAKAANAEDARLGVAFRMGVKVLLVVGLALGVVGTILGRPVFLMLFGDRFSEAALPFQLLLWSQCFTFLAFFIVDFNNSQNRQGRNTLFMLCMVGAALPVQWLLISRLGVPGAGWAKLLLSALGLAVLCAFSWKGFTRQQARVALFAALALTGFVVVALVHLRHLLPTVLSGGLLMLLFCVSLHRVFSPEEKELLRQAVRTAVPGSLPAPLA